MRAQLCARHQGRAGWHRPFGALCRRLAYAPQQGTGEEGPDVYKRQVLQAVQEGEIHLSRHTSYVAMYNEVKDLKEWEMK